MFYQREKEVFGRQAIVAWGLGRYSLKDTLECGQCFRYEIKEEREDYREYITVVNDKIINVGQRTVGELIFFDMSEVDFLSSAVPYFSLDTDYEKIRKDIISKTDSEWLTAAAEYAGGIVILKQDPWETLISFIISQNNNIPRIRKIIKRICAEYGVNLSLQNGAKSCPVGKIDCAPCEEKCRECGICYTFPTARDINQNPERLLSSNPGFRYKYLCDAARRVDTGETNLEMIAAARSYTHTLVSLKEILGVGDKVASCTALFGFGNLEAFPVDVWMRRAIDDYFDGELNPLSLGRYAGVAQQYIFHYIRKLSDAK